MNRLAGRVIALLIFVMILPTVFAVLGSFMDSAIAASLPKADLVDSLVGLLLGLVFIAGLLVRAHGGGGEESEEQRRARLTVRRPVEALAEDIAEIEDEADPLVPWDEE